MPERGTAAEKAQDLFGVTHIEDAEQARHFDMSFGFCVVLTIGLQNLTILLTLPGTCAKLTGEYLHLRAKTFVAIYLVRL
jgi:hypothetical protein